MNGATGAFPFQYLGSHGGPTEPDFGLTKRELIAAMAMQGLASDPNCTGNVQSVAECAVKWADCLLAELAKDGAQ